jgi:hypothetical protein
LAFFLVFAMLLARCVNKHAMTAQKLCPLIGCDNSKMQAQVPQYKVRHHTGFV